MNSNQFKQFPIATLCVSLSTACISSTSWLFMCTMLFIWLWHKKFNYVFIGLYSFSFYSKFKYIVVVYMQTCGHPYMGDKLNHSNWTYDHECVYCARCSTHHNDNCNAIYFTYSYTDKNLSKNICKLQGIMYRREGSVRGYRSEISCTNVYCLLL